MHHNSTFPNLGVGRSLSTRDSGYFPSREPSNDVNSESKVSLRPLSTLDLGTGATDTEKERLIVGNIMLKERIAYLERQIQFQRRDENLEISSYGIRGERMVWW